MCVPSWPHLSNGRKRSTLACLWNTLSRNNRYFGANARVLKLKGVSAWTLVYFLNWLHNTILRWVEVKVFEKYQCVSNRLQTVTEVCDDTRRLNASRPSCRCLYAFPKINCRAPSTVCLWQHNRFYMAILLCPLECTHALNATSLLEAPYLTSYCI